MKKVRVVIIYEAMGEQIPLGTTDDLRTSVLVKRQLIRDAEERYEAVKSYDEVLATEFGGALSKLRTTLDLVIPPEMEELALIPS
jgi:hypothetical protein